MWLVLADFPVSEPLLLEESGHGQVMMFPINSTKQTLSFVLTGKGQVPRYNFLALVLADRRQISIGGSFRARSPDPAQPSSLTEPGITDWPALRLLRHFKLQGEVLETTYVPGRWPLPSGHRGGDGEKLTTASRPGARPMGGLGKNPRALQNRVLLAQRLGEPREPRKSFEIHLLPHFAPEDHHSADGWWNAPTKEAY